jgi:replicative DNA helicase
LDDKTTTVLKAFGRYFAEFPDHEKIEIPTFMSVFFNFYHKDLDDTNRVFYERIIKGLNVEVDEQTKATMIDRLSEVDYSMQAAQLLQDYADGKDFDLIHSLSELTDKVKAQLEKRVKIPWVNDPIEELLVEDEQDGGLHWRLPCLNESMRPLRGGDFGIIAGRPDSGKTTFLTCELTYMANQFDMVYGAESEPRYILWFNNEGPGKRIVTRGYQSALGVSTPDLVGYKQDGTLVQRYINAVGAIDRIRIIDVHDMWSHDILDICDAMVPGLIVFDMIDNIKFSGELGGSARTDQVLEAQYQWARLLGVKYDCPVLATSQISNEGDGELFPTLGMLKDSKTGKQGACDFQLMIGKNNQPNMEDIRGIGLVKNKLHRFGYKKDPRATVNFVGQTGRYELPVEV